MCSQLLPQRDKCLAKHQPVLGSTQCEDIHPATGGNLFQCHVQISTGIGNAGAIHKEIHIVGMCQVGKCPYFTGCIAGTQLCCLRDAITFWLGMMFKPKPCRCGRTSSGVSFPSGVTISFSVAPVNFTGAPHSSTAMCAVAAQRMEWKGRVQLCNPTTFAPVPLIERTVSMLLSSSKARTSSSACRVHLSSP